MKLIEINIGLSSKTLGSHNPIAVINSLTGRGFIVLKYRLVKSVCKDGEETCLAVKAECPNDWQEQLARLSNHLGQDCIAIVGFIGHSPYDTFVPSLWKSPEETEETIVDLVSGFTLEGFKAYLENSIIPDSRESGYDGYADDLQTALDFIRQLSSKPFTVKPDTETEKKLKKFEVAFSSFDPETIEAETREEALLIYCDSLDIDITENE